MRSGALGITKALPAVLMNARSATKEVIFRGASTAVSYLASMDYKEIAVEKSTRTAKSDQHSQGRINNVKDGLG